MYVNAFFLNIGGHEPIDWRQSTFIGFVASNNGCVISMLYTIVTIENSVAVRF